MAGPGRVTPGAAALVDSVRHAVPPGPLAVALSGGADSAVCAWAAIRAGDGPVRAIVADHGLPESAALVEAARRVAAVLGIPCVVVPAPAGDASEAALRRARYRAIEDAAAAGETLLSGHTADDQAETVLGNLIRGAGAAGLAGIPARRGRWARPLLGVGRDRTRAVAAALGLPFADDPGNVDPAVRRSLIRTEVMPSLQRLNPSLREALMRAGRLAGDDDAVLEERAAEVPIRVASGEVHIPAAALAALPAAVASRVARRGLRAAAGPYAGDLGDVEALLGAARGTAATLSGGLLAGREGPWVVIHRPEDPVVPPPAPLAVPGEAVFGRWRLRAASGPAPVLPNRWRVALGGEGPLRVRAAVPGESIGMGRGSKRVADALREAGVPPRMRAAWPVVERAGRMAWVVGARLAPGEAAAAGEPAVVVEAGGTA